MGFGFNETGLGTNTDKIKDKKTRVGAEEQLPGLYRARVEYNRDPRGLGRVKVRIPQLHKGGNGEEDSVGERSLPWAFPGNFSMAGCDFGEFMVPPVGALVWIAFEAGDTEKPVYFGGVPVHGETKKTYNKIPGAKWPKDNSSVDYMGPWEASLGKDDISAPKEIYDKRGNEKNPRDITRQVVYKSVKGHTIHADDTDEKESFTFTDRLGQVLKFISPVTKSGNSANASRRGNKNTFEGDTLPPSSGSVYGNRAVILIKDIAHQILRFVSADNGEKIELMSRNRGGGRNSGTVYRAGSTISFEHVAESGGSRAVLTGSASNGTISIMVAGGNSCPSKIVITTGGVTIETTGNLAMKGNNSVNIQSGSGVINLNTNKSNYGATSLGQRWSDSEDENYIK